MTKGEIRRFVDECDNRCRKAYENRAKWFMQCVKSERGNDILSMWLSHWLAGFYY